ncbi:MAG: T9SS type A sorting domain-containing protein [Bacteroidota bacterium]
MKTKLFSIRLSTSAGGILLVIFLSIVFETQAQSKFTRLFWQNIGEIFKSSSVIEISGGGYVMAGTVKDSAAGSLTDVFLAKFSSIGDTVWTRRIAAGGTEDVYDIQQTNDGGYILTGYSDASGYGILLLKTDSLGYVSWAKVFGNFYEFGYSVRQNADNGYIIAAHSSQGGLIIRTNSMGDTLWTKNYGLGSGSEASYAEETPGGDFIIALNVDSNSFDQYALILKVTSSGSLIWARKVGSLFGSTSLITYDIKQTMDGGYLLTGEENMTFSEIIVLKFDSNGNLSFGKMIDPAAENFYLLKATELADSTYLIVNSFHSSMANGGTFFVRLNQAGDTISTGKYSNVYFKNGGAFTSDGGFVAADYFNGIHKLDSSLNMECNSPGINLYSVTYYNYTSSNSFPVVSGGGTTVTNATYTNIGGVTRKLYTPCTPTVPTCVVTVDSATQKNLVVWEENFDTTFVDSYQVYKESAAAGIYNLIGSIPHNQLSIFLDNASNPAVQAERYRVSALWHTYYEPPNAVAGHKTIHLSISPGLPPAINLNWSSYEGFTYPTYNIWRGNGISASIIGSVPFGTNSYTDLTPPAGDSLYFIEVAHAACTPSYFLYNSNGGTEDVTSFTQYNGTISNSVHNSTSVGITEANWQDAIFLSPNPVMNQLKIESLNLNLQFVEIFDVVGQGVVNYEFHNANFKVTTIDVSQLNPGIYFVKVKSEYGERVGKFMKK